jgi:VIT1/CCC1 family predicted Fe2+/Mn2+ transporter
MIDRIDRVITRAGWWLIIGGALYVAAHLIAANLELAARIVGLAIAALFIVGGLLGRVKVQ